MSISNVFKSIAINSKHVLNASSSFNTLRRGFHASLIQLDVKVVPVPTMADSITEGELVSLEKEIGEGVEMDEVVATIETDKVNIEVSSPVKGVVTSYHQEIGSTVMVGQDLFSVDTDKVGESKAKDVSEPKAADTPATPAAPAAPVTKKSEAPTTTPPTATATPAATTPPKASSKEELPFGAPRPERRLKMPRMRLRIAERLKDAQNEYAMLTTFNEIDMSNIMALRSQYKDEFLKKHNIKLGFMSCFSKAAANALMESPAVNAVIDGKDFLYRDYADISVAVATPKGLVVPVLRDVQNMSFVDIERTIASLGARARDGELAIEDMAGGTFTISNGGVYGSLMGTPILNPPQSAILGMHGIFDRPIAVNGKVEIRPMMYVALTYDHRIIDGREAVTFLKSIKNQVEDPRRILLEL